MLYYYDNYGWLTARVLPGRTTAVPPPAEVPAGFKPNFTGHKWILMPYVRPPIDLAEAQTRAERLVQKRIDDFAATRGYDNANSMAKYQNISNADIASLPPSEQAMVLKFRAECRYVAIKTAQTWARCYQILGELVSGERSYVPEEHEFLAELPPLKWPDEQ